MKPIQIISQDLFDKVRSRFSNLEMGDETGAVTIDPQTAMFFDFDFVQEGVNLGRVSISLNDLGSLKVYYSQGITENQDDPAKKLWYSFLKEMRMFAMRRLLRFDTRDIAKTNLNKNDFQHLATTQGPTEDEGMNKMNESKWNQKSTRKTSRAARGATEVIMRHEKAVDEEYAGSRSRTNNIKSIFIQNKDGERFKYPFIHPAGAFAMAQHVDHGGAPYDAPGKAIIKMSEQIAQLQAFQRHIRPTSLHDDAMGIATRAHGKLAELKAQIESLGKRHHYQTWMSEFAETPDDNAVMELDAVTMEDYKQKFTQTNFKEELASFFPLIHSIMRETNAIDLEQFVEDVTDDDNTDDVVRTSESDQFEAWADAVEQNKLTPDQIAELKNALAGLESGQELELGPDGQTAWNFFSEFGINDDDLERKFKEMAGIDATTDPIEVFQAWARDAYPELLVALGMSETGQPEPEQASTDDMEPEEPVAEDEGEQTPAADPRSMMKEIAEVVRSFYNRDNPTVGPFRGEEGISLDVGKQISEKYGEQAGDQARQIAEKFMQKLTGEWEQRHGTTAGPSHGEPDGHTVDDGGLARLKELVGTIKTKLENKDVEPNLKSNIMRDPGMEEGMFDMFKKKSSSPAAEPREVAGPMTKEKLQNLINNLERRSKNQNIGPGERWRIEDRLTRLHGMMSRFGDVDMEEGMFDMFKKKSAEPTMQPITSQQRNLIRQALVSSNVDAKWGGDESEYVLPLNAMGVHARGRIHFRNQDGQLMASVEHYRSVADRSNMKQPPAVRSDHKINSLDDIEQLKRAVDESVNTVAHESNVQESIAHSDDAILAEIRKLTKS